VIFGPSIFHLLFKMFVCFSDIYLWNFPQFLRSRGRGLVHVMCLLARAQPELSLLLLLLLGTHSGKLAAAQGSSVGGGGVVPNIV
jgi:hypothetical protein